jgi:ankyrin repeat protein
MKEANSFRLLWALLSVVPLGVARADGIDEPIPSFYQEPGLSQNRDTVAQHPNERVDPFTGKLQWHFVDVFIPGNGGLDIRVQRSYSSLNEILGEDSPFGEGWTMHFGRVLRKADIAICALGQNPTSNPVLELPDGSRQIMHDGLDGIDTITPGLWKGTCNNAPEGGLIVQSPDGTRYEMTTAGPPVGSGPAKLQNTFYTTRIIDRNGNTLNLTYGLQGGTAFGVQSISASDGRTVTFNYVGATLSTIVTSAGTWTYSLTQVPNTATNQFFLSQVARPDGTTWKYEYNPTSSGPGVGTPGGYSMKKVTYPTGGTISYTYGFIIFNANVALPPSTVVAQKQSSEGTWTYAYQPATTPVAFLNGAASYVIDPAAPNTQFDRTTVTGPEGSTQFLHLGYTSVSPGSVYLIGTLAGKIASSNIGGQLFFTQLESNSWGHVLISSQPNVRPGNSLAFDSETDIPLLTEHQVSRNGQIYKTDYSNFDAFTNPQTIVETGTDTRTTTVTYFTDATRWIIHQKKDETTDTIGTITRTFDPLNGNNVDEALGWAPVFQDNKTIALLLAAGANVNALGKLKNPQSDYSAATEASIRARSGERDLMRLLLRYKIDLKAPAGRTSALGNLVSDVEFLPLLIAGGADPNHADENGNTPLLLATRVPRSSIIGGDAPPADTALRMRSVELLLAAGADPTIANKQGVTPLMQSLSDETALVHALVIKGGTVRIDPRLADSYRREGNPMGPVSWAVVLGKDALGAELIARQPKVGPDDCGAVYYAALGGAARTLTALLDAKAPVCEVKNVNQPGMTPLIIAAFFGSAATVKILLDHGAAKVDETTPRKIAMLGNEGGGWIGPTGGETALMWAARMRYLDVVKELLRQGANVNRKSFDGRTALDYARNYGTPEITSLLETYGAR